ncbi:hypothetical protein EBU71_01395 [bacterium]|nr:hypothetical protein [Candidatus Elulimicrobium humile]
MPYLGREPNYGSLEVQVFTPNSVSTSFGLDYPIGSASSILLIRAGTILIPGIDYTLLNGGNTISIAGAAIASGTALHAIYLSKQSLLNTVANNTLIAEKFADSVTSKLPLTHQIKTSDFTASKGNFYWVNSSAGNVTVTLPATAVLGDSIWIGDLNRTWGTVSQRVILNTNGHNVDGSGTSPINPISTTAGQIKLYTYTNITQGWRVNTWNN